MNNTKKQGFTVVEILITITILSLGVFPFLRLIGQNTKSAVNAKQRFVATHYAKELMEEIKLKEFGEVDENGEVDGDPDNTAPDRTEWETIDHYDGYNHDGIRTITGGAFSPGSKFDREVTVKYVASDLETVTTSGITTSNAIKKVEVKCYFKNDADKPRAKSTWYKRYSE